MDVPVLLGRAQVEFSPFVDNLVAVGTAQYFGIIGNGKQSVYEMLPSGELALVSSCHKSWTSCVYQ